MAISSRATFLRSGAVAATALSFSLWIPGAATAAPMSFSGVGDIPGNTYASRATAVSGNGRVVFGWSDGIRIGDCWEPVDGDPANGCPDEDHAFRWTPTTGIVALEASCDGGGGQICGGGVGGASYDGAIAVGWDHGGGGDDEDAPAWWYSDGSTGGIGNDGGASDVSADGLLVVGGVGDTYPQSSGAFRYNIASGQYDALGTLPGASYSGDSYASGISADGSIVVGTGGSFAGLEAFVLTEADGLQPRWTPDNRPYVDVS